jgi:hypothetical protein
MDTLGSNIYVVGSVSATPSIVEISFINPLGLSVLNTFSNIAFGAAVDLIIRGNSIFLSQNNGSGSPIITQFDLVSTSITSTLLGTASFNELIKLEGLDDQNAPNVLYGINQNGTSNLGVIGYTPLTTSLIQDFSVPTTDGSPFVDILIDTS